MMNRNKLALVIALIFFSRRRCRRNCLCSGSPGAAGPGRESGSRAAPAHLHFLSMAARFLAFMPKKITKENMAAMACVKARGVGGDPGRQGQRRRKSRLEERRCNPSLDGEPR